MCFPVSSVEFLRTPFLQNTFGQPFLNSLKRIHPALCWTATNPQQLTCQGLVG